MAHEINGRITGDTNRDLNTGMYSPKHLVEGTLEPQPADAEAPDAMIRRADAFAEKAHAGQVDKSGQDYIEHPRRIARKLELCGAEPKVIVVALLHDVIEDTDFDKNDILDLYPDNPEIADAVEAISTVPNEPKDDYYARVKANPLALEVKAGDISDNTDPRRVAQLDEVTRRRLSAKYDKAKHVLGIEGSPIFDHDAWLRLAQLDAHIESVGDAIRGDGPNRGSEGLASNRADLLKERALAVGRLRMQA